MVYPFYFENKANTEYVNIINKLLNSEIFWIFEAVWLL